MMQEVRVKAVPVNGLYEFVAGELSSEQLNAVLAKLPPGDAQWFTGHLLAHELVPLAAVNQFTKLAAAEVGEPPSSFGRRAGRYGARLGLKTVYKFVMMVLSIEAVLKKAPFMWSRVYDRGTVTVESTSTGAKLRVRDFTGDPAGCGRVAGWFEVIATEAGAKDVRLTHSSCTSEGADECVWEGIWK